MRVAKYEFLRRLKFIFFIVFLAILYSCSSTTKELINTNNKGGYKLMTLDKNKDISSDDEVIIIGKVVDLVTNEPLVNSELTIGCNKFYTSSNGEYSFKIKKSEILYIKTSSIGYKKIETSFLNFKQKNLIKIDFFLEEDDRPLINCEGNI